MRGLTVSLRAMKNFPESLERGRDRVSVLQVSHDGELDEQRHKRRWIEIASR